ncbi:MAG: hypothetical protein ACYDHZ_00640 [Dehalococcoidia bacterium]
MDDIHITGKASIQVGPVKLDLSLPGAVDNQEGHTAILKKRRDALLEELNTIDKELKGGG